MEYMSSRAPTLQAGEQLRSDVMVSDIRYPRGALDCLRRCTDVLKAHSNWVLQLFPTWHRAYMALFEQSVQVNAPATSSRETTNLVIPAPRQTYEHPIGTEA